MSITFKDKYLSFFDSVCIFMGNDWRVNKIRCHDYRIFIFSPRFKNYSISVGLEKNKFHVVGSVDSRVYRSAINNCNLSTNRSPEAIAIEIKNRILFDMVEQIEKVQEYQKKQEVFNEEKQLIKNLLSKFFSLSGHYGKWHRFRSEENKLSGYIDHHNYSNGYSLKIDNLTADQLIKVSAFIKDLK